MVKRRSGGEISECENRIIAEVADGNSLKNVLLPCLHVGMLLAGTGQRMKEFEDELE